MKNSKMKIMFLIVILMGTGMITSCKKKKVLKSISGIWIVEDITENGASIFTVDNVLNKGTINFGDCTSKENKNAECEAVISYEMTILSVDTTLNSTVKYSVVEKGSKILFGDLNMDVITLEDNKCVLTDSESSEKYTYKLIK